MKNESRLFQPPLFVITVLGNVCYSKTENNNPKGKTSFALHYSYIKLMNLRRKLTVHC